MFSSLSSAANHARIKPITFPPKTHTSVPKLLKLSRTTHDKQPKIETFAWLKKANAMNVQYTVGGESIIFSLFQQPTTGNVYAIR